MDKVFKDIIYKQIKLIDELIESLSKTSHIKQQSPPFKELIKYCNDYKDFLKSNEIILIDMYQTQDKYYIKEIKYVFEKIIFKRYNFNIFKQNFILNKKQISDLFLISEGINDYSKYMKNIIWSNIDNLRKKELSIHYDSIDNKC